MIREETQLRLYHMLLHFFITYKGHGLDNDTAYTKAKLKLVDSFLYQTNIEKEELAAFWHNTKHMNFTQKLAHDYAKNKRAAADKLRPFVG